MIAQSAKIVMALELINAGVITLFAATMILLANRLLKLARKLTEAMAMPVDLRVQVVGPEAADEVPEPLAASEQRH